MRWRVAFWERGQVVFRSSRGGWAWDRLPLGGVLWVDLVWGPLPWRQRLQGRDNYWLSEARRLVGAFNDRANLGMYGGDLAAQAEAFELTSAGVSRVRIELRELMNERVLAGVMLPDAAWEGVRRAYPLVLA